MTMPYPSDMIGYGRNPSDPKWPGGVRVAKCLSNSTSAPYIPG
jgi:hypothetical protein